MRTGFITQDNYAAIPYGTKQLIVIYNGQQLEVVNTQAQAKKFIEQHRSTPEAGTVFLDSSSSCGKIKRPRKKS
jgi:hypothetical protein